MGYSGETAMKTEDDLASGILLLATIETLLVVLSRMLSAPTEPQAQNSLARYRLQARKGQQVRLRLYPGSERWRLLARIEQYTWEFRLAFRLSVSPTK